MPQSGPGIKGAEARSRDLQAFHQPPMPLGDRNRAVRRPLDIDMSVAASRGGLIGPGFEHREVVAHRRAAEMLDRKADFSRLGIGEAGIEAAIAFDDKAD